MNAAKLIIFDTTLRDGEQSPGASMDADRKLRIAKALERLRVDVIEAGFAVSSPGDFASVQAIAKTVRDSRVCSLARAVRKDIEQAAEALRPAAAPRIHTFIATSGIHMRYKLQMEPQQVLERAVEAVRLARQHTDDVEFSCEDASRSELDFLCRIIEAVIRAGASTINIPDTVGYGVPERFGALIAALRERVPNADQATFSVHCHNDLGLAVANSLAAVAQGARQVECTVNGLGERTGNASLEEIVMAIRTRHDVYGLETDIDTRQIVPTSRLVSTLSGFPVQPNKAVVGVNAFAHEAGIHQDGVLKRRETYEIMRAEDVGWGSNKLVLGKHSGRAAFRARLEQLGIPLDDKALEQAFARFKELADKKQEIFDADLQALAGGLSSAGPEEVHRLEVMQVVSASGKACRAELKLSMAGRQAETAAEGHGPVDAAFRAVEKLVRSGAQLLLYSVNAITGGTDSQGEVTVRLEREGRVVNGIGTHTDIIEASVRAYLHALNLLEAGEQARVVEGI